MNTMAHGWKKAPNRGRENPVDPATAEDLVLTPAITKLGDNDSAVEQEHPGTTGKRTRTDDDLDDKMNGGDDR